MLPEPEKKTVDYYRRLSEKDLMTGLYNRGSFEYYVKKRLESGEGGIFYMIDLDDFKAVNDTYGHVAGDKVIMDMADILRRIFAKEAVIGRLGGDEFAVYEAGCCGRKEAEGKARAVLQDYSALSEKYGNDFQLSCSIGMYREADKETFENLYSRADEALYFQKFIQRHLPLVLLPAQILISSVSGVFFCNCPHPARVLPSPTCACGNPGGGGQLLFSVPIFIQNRKGLHFWKDLW